MTNKNYNHTELIWDGKFEQLTKLPKKRTIDKVVLPFQTIEVINEPREGTGSGQLFGGKKKEGWRNKLIWGDNKLVMSSLLKDYAGKINLIYIDPPFDVGADFSIKVKVGNEEITKKPSILEEKAYRDTWGSGINSYLQMMYERLFFMRELLSENGSIYIHLDWRVTHYIKVILDDIFGKDNFLNHIAWRREVVRGMKTHAKFFGNNIDSLLYYAKNKDNTIWNKIEGKREISKKELEKYELDERGYFTTSDPGTYTKDSLIDFYQEGRLYITQKGKASVINGELKISKGVPRIKYYLDKIGNKYYKNFTVDNLWNDIIGIASLPGERTGYPTQKPEALLERTIKASSNEGDLVADFFCGSGTAGAVAEKLGRRWIMSDLGRFAIHTSRKRLMEIQRKSKEGSRDYYPFEVLNLGKYERQYWQTALLNKSKETDESKKIVQYIKFIIELYKGEVITGFKNIHGKKDNIFIHIGAVDAPVTMNEIREAVEECKKNKFTNLDILGWEWEMGVNEEAIKWAKGQSVKLRLLQIPREVMEKRAVETGDVRFFELNYVEVNATRKGQEVKVALKNFAIPSEEFIPNELREKIENWSDYIDYWSVDWDYESLKSKDGEPIFENDWQTFRTKKNPRLELETPLHKYSKKGKYLILVKVVDIFGNDTSKVVEVKI